MSVDSLTQVRVQPTRYNENRSRLAVIKKISQLDKMIRKITGLNPGAANIFLFSSFSCSTPFGLFTWQMYDTDTCVACVSSRCARYRPCSKITLIFFKYGPSPAYFRVIIAKLFTNSFTTDVLTINWAYPRLC